LYSNFSRILKKKTKLRGKKDQQKKKKKKKEKTNNNKLFNKNNEITCITLENYSHGK
jgi:hypothetical protein